MKYYMVRKIWMTDMHFDWDERDIFCFDLVRGMDNKDETGKLVYADVLKDEDFHNDKRKPKSICACIGTNEDLAYDYEQCFDGSTWYFDEYYTRNGDFRSTKTSEGIDVTHGKKDNEAIVDVYGDKVVFLILPNQAEIRALLVLLNAKQSTSINPLRKLPIEMFRLVKNFLI
jgi:hypothetical protein